MVVSLLTVPLSKAITEANYEQGYRERVIPFMKEGEEFTFQSADHKFNLSAIRFGHRDYKGVIVILNGRAESWLKYGELFYDLHLRGYTLYSYDHRGQGLSPHLGGKNTQMGHVDDFREYARDLDAFLKEVTRKERSRGKNLFLIAHSMGGAVALEYLGEHSSPFQGIVLCSPMIEINTSPYPNWLAHGIVGILKGIGLGRSYAIGEHDYDPDPSGYQSNKVTSSHSRWNQGREIWKEHPEAVIGGASNGWVDESLSMTKKIRKTSHSIGSANTKILLLMAGKDRLVRNPSESTISSLITYPRMVAYPDSKHEILMERDSIRLPAIDLIDRFFKNVCRSDG